MIFRKDPAVFDKWITEHEFADNVGEILGGIDLIPYKRNGKIYMKFLGRRRRETETAIFVRTYLALIDAGFPMDVNYLSFVDELEGSEYIMFYPFGVDSDRTLSSAIVIHMYIWEVTMWRRQGGCRTMRCTG